MDGDISARSTLNQGEEVKLMLVGHGRAGKDEAGEWFARNTSLTFAGTTSKYLAKYVAAELGVTEDECYATRHDNREKWWRIGKKVREQDPGCLIRESLAHGDVIGGVRDLVEVIYARESRCVDLIIWIARNSVSVDPTVEFDSSHCDMIIENHWGLEEYHNRLKRLATALGIYRPRSSTVASAKRFGLCAEPVHPRIQSLCLSSTSPQSPINGE